MIKAKLFFLKGYDWDTIVSELKKEGKENDIIIYQLMNKESKQQHYALVSLSSTAEDTITRNHGIISANSDIMINALHNYNGDVLYGDKENIVFLDKI